MPDGANVSRDLSHQEAFDFAGRDYVPAGGEHNVLLLKETNGSLLGQEQLLASGRDYDASLLRQARVAFSGAENVSERPKHWTNVPANLEPTENAGQFNERVLER